jgi:hypothetical protein
VIGSGVLASIGAIATGALLARYRPLRRWGEDTSRDRGPGRRGGPPDGAPPGGPPPGGPPPSSGK